MKLQHGGRRRSTWVGLLLGASFVMATVFPGAAGAASDVDKRNEARRKKAEAAAQLDVLEARHDQVTQALGALDDNLTAQKQLTVEAAQAEARAQTAASEAKQAEAGKQAEITGLQAEARNVAVAMYMGRTGSGVATFLPGTDPDEAIYRGAMTELVLGGAESSLDALDAAREDLADARATAETAEQAAAKRREQSEAQSRQLADAIAMSEQKQSELEARVEQNLAEVASLSTLDAQLSQQIQAREAAIAAELQRSQARLSAQAASTGRSPQAGSRSGSRPAVIPAGGNLVTVAGIKVDASISDALARMVAAAAADGFNLGGGGYRSADAQIAVRRTNCGSSEYDIWQKPASQCRPPAARPGTSMHERGLAIDFTCNGPLIGSYSSPCYAWMRANAPGFGFQNRPGEAWHWSPNGN